MKKSVALFLVIMIFVGIIPAISAENEVKNLLDNGGFEVTLDKQIDDVSYIWPATWTASGDGKENTNFYLSKDNALSGKYSMCIEGEESSNSSRVAVPVYGLIEGLPYEITGYINTDGVTKNGVSVYARQSVSSGTVYPQSLMTTFNTNSDWQKFSTKFVAPSDKAFIWLVKNGGGKVYFDDISVHPVKDFAINGSFEYGVQRDSTNPRLLGWTNSTFSWSSDAEIKSKNAFEGNSYIELSSGSKDKALISTFSTASSSPYFKISTEYTLTLAAKAKSNTEFIAKVEYLNADKVAISEDKKQFTTKGDKWEEFELKFKLPENTETVKLYLYGGSNEIGYDAVKITTDNIDELYSKATKEEKTIIKEPIEGYSNVIKNDGFEEIGPDGKPSGFKALDDFSGTYVSIDKQNPHSGDNCIKIKTDQSGKNPWVRYFAQDVIAGAEYQVSAWLRRIAVSNDTGPYVKFECYNANEVTSGAGTGDTVSQSFINSSKIGIWTQVAATVKIPENTKGVALYFRLSGTGEIYWDDLQFYLTKLPAKITGSSDQVFYYSDVITGIFTATPEISINEIPKDSYIDFYLKRNGNVVDEMLNIKAEKQTKYEFAISKLSEKGQPYIIEGQYKNADGSLIETVFHEIYRYDRPSVLNKEGLYIENGKVFTPVFAYHVYDWSDENLKRIKQTGANTVQLGYDSGETLLKYLDILKKHDMMGQVCLYPNMIPAGAEKNREKTIEKVQAVKDHPAVFGYVTMDEPFLHDAPHIVYENLKASYKIIRDIDPVHPVMICESSSMIPFYKHDVLFCDAFIIDPYPRYENRMPTWPGTNANAAKEACSFTKPVYTLLQAYELVEYTPTPNSMLHMTYQHFFEGGEGLGYFRFDKGSKEVEPPMYKYDLWSGAVKLGDGKEIKELENLFLLGNYPIINQVMTDDLWYIIYAQGNDVYLIILNKLYDKEQNIEIKLVSYDNSVKLGEFTASVVNGFGSGKDVSGNGVFKTTLAKADAVKYKLTFTETYDFSKLKGMKYRDLGRHSWARMQIESLKGLGIVNDISDASFRPAKKITRAEFAMFLIRTLKLDAEVSVNDNFLDVSPDSEYAKELAVGKALGILNGIGDGKFAPLAEISRQDMMTIIARGMNLKDENFDLSQFSDYKDISDYAISGIKGMVSSKLVVGNADGTINPKGNATRAEAAVIMYRILNK